VLLDDNAVVRNKLNFMIPFLREYASADYLEVYDKLIDKEVKKLNGKKLKIEFFFD